MARQARYDRDTVLQKAQALFWAKGYLGTSLKDLETALDMRPGSIYAAFGSKEGLFVEVLRLYAQNGQAALHDSLADAPTALDGLARHARSMICAAPGTAPPARACMLAKTVLETPDDDPTIRQEAERLMRGAEAGFAEAFAEAKARGELPASADPERLASWLQARLIGLRAYAQRSDSLDRSAELADDLYAEILALGSG